MSALPFVLPSIIPPPDDTSISNPPLTGADSFSQYDVAIGGIGFMYAQNSSQGEALVRETVPAEKTRVDQEATPGEQTLTSWWIRSQASFHGGAGQPYLEPSIGTDVTPQSVIRYDCSKNVDPFTPGQVVRLPDGVMKGTDSASQVVSFTSGGNDWIAYLNTADSGVYLMRPIISSPPTTVLSGLTDPTLAIASDGYFVYAVTSDGSTVTDVYQVDPATPTMATHLATTAAGSTQAALGWVKSRLMLGVLGAVYELDVSTSGVTLGATELRYQHPVAAFQWLCFAAGPRSIIAAGDAGGESSIVAFDIDTSTGAPILGVFGEVADLPIGERVLSMAGVQGSYLAVGTSLGIRVGTYNTYTGNLSLGPLTLNRTDPTIPCNAVVARESFIFAVGSDYDEAGLLCLDLGTVNDQAGRYAWAPHLTTADSLGVGKTASCAAVLPRSNRIVFAVPGAGIYLEGIAPGSSREAWLRTSRVRFGTTEPKLFKFGRVRGSLASGEIQVTGTTPLDPTETLATVGFAVFDPPEFRLPSEPTEWLQLQLSLLGSTAVLNSYSVKALPGTRKQRYIQMVLAEYDKETTKTGQRITEELAARDRLARLEAIDASGDEVLLQEFTPTGVISTIGVVEKLSFRQPYRPTKRSDIGGTVNVLFRTTES